MKKILLFTVLFTTLSCMNSYANSNTQSLDRIVAVVNDEVVTKSEVNHSLTIIKAQIAQAQASMPSDEALQKQALELIINKKLQMQIAKQVGVSVTDEDVNRVVENISKKNNLTTAELYQRISQDGLDASEYRNQLREQMTIQKVQQQEVAGHLTVTPDEINRFLNSKVWQSKTNNEYHLEDILIPTSDSASPEEINQAQEHARATLAKLQNGKPITEKVEDLGWRKFAEIPSIFAQHVSGMRSKEIAGPIQAPNGFHLLRLIAARSDDKSEAPNRTQVQQLLMQRKFQENVDNWISKMRSQAFITTNMKA